MIFWDPGVRCMLLASGCCAAPYGAYGANAAAAAHPARYGSSQRDQQQQQLAACSLRQRQRAAATLQLTIVELLAHVAALACLAALCCFRLQLSTVLGAAIPEERHEGKWIEGIAIWVAIFLVTFVSEWRLCCRFCSFCNCPSSVTSLSVELIAASFKTTF